MTIRAQAGTVGRASRETWIGVALVLAVSVPLALAASVRAPLDPLWLPLALGIGLLALAALLRPIEPAPGEKFSLAGSVSFFGALVLPGAFAVTALTGAAFVAKLSQRASLQSTIVNTVKVGGAVGAASLAAESFGGTTLAEVIVCAMAYLALTLGSVATMIGATQGLAPIAAFLRREWLQSTGLVSVGGAAALMWARDPLALVLLVPPLALIEIAARARARERAAVEALRRASEAQSAFASDAAHELRTPLATLVGNLAYVREDSLPPDEAAALADARRDGKTLTALVDRLLLLARTEAVEAQDAATDLAVVVGRVASSLPIRHGSVALDFAMPSDAIARVPADLAEAALRAVLTNAASYTEAGHIGIRARVVGAYVDVTVSDTGIGIPAEEIGRVFERFYRGSKARRLAGGTGLGLSIVRRVLEAIGGSVALESRAGQGTTVTLRFPRAS